MSCCTISPPLVREPDRWAGLYLEGKNLNVGHTFHLEAWLQTCAMVPSEGSSRVAIVFTIISTMTYDCPCTPSQIIPPTNTKSTTKQITVESQLSEEINYPNPQNPKVAHANLYNFLTTPLTVITISYGF